ncbi:armadillo-type protein [Mycena polygramma]|nr:armadillo-type protein [Mycena polygramma]
MYHRQAMEFINKTRGSPLSTETMEIYSSYLPWNFVSLATKAKILSELIDRATFEADARIMIGSPGFDSFLIGMLDSPDPRVQISSCALVGALATHECTAPAILDLKPCARLMSLLSDKDIEVSLEATHALSKISQWPDGAQAIVNVHGLRYALELLQSPNIEVQRWACELVRKLAGHESTASAISELKLPEWVMLRIREPSFARYWLPRLELEYPRSGSVTERDYVRREG